MKVKSVSSEICRDVEFDILYGGEVQKRVDEAILVSCVDGVGVEVLCGKVSQALLFGPTYAMLDRLHTFGLESEFESWLMTLRKGGE